MEAFYIIVLSIAIILLILVLTYVGIQMTSANSATKKSTFPPQASSCPDYWQSVTTDTSSCLIPTKNSQNVGKIYDASNGSLLLNSSTTYGLNTMSNSINFANSRWATGGVNTICAQKSWANQYGLMWDGVSNYNSC
jgi:hypothetical protein